MALITALDGVSSVRRGHVSTLREQVSLIGTLVTNKRCEAKDSEGMEAKLIPHSSDRILSLGVENTDKVACENSHCTDTTSCGNTEKASPPRCLTDIFNEAPNREKKGKNRRLHFVQAKGNLPN